MPDNVMVTPRHRCLDINWVSMPLNTPSIVERSEAEETKHGIMPGGHKRLSVNIGSRPTTFARAKCFTLGSWRWESAISWTRFRANACDHLSYYMVVIELEQSRNLRSPQIDQYYHWCVDAFACRHELWQPYFCIALGKEVSVCRGTPGTPQAV